MTQNNQSINRDEELAAFADQVVDGKEADLSMVGSDPEMRALAETILRLDHAFPKQKPNPASMNRIRSAVLVEWRNEEQKKARRARFLSPGWLSWFKRPQFAMAVAVIAVVGLLVVFSPYLISSGGPVTGAAGSDSPVSILAWILLGILIVVTIWLTRRRS